MKKVVVDTNIIFAGLRSVSTSLREKLSNPHYRFYAPKFLFVEIFKHKERILKHTSADEDIVLEYLSLLLYYMHFIDESIISNAEYLTAYSLCKDVDEKDTPFVALSLTLECDLWTRDVQLKTGLRAKGFNHFFDEEKM